MYNILFIPVNVKSNDDSVAETLTKSLEECYVTHNWEWIMEGWSIDELKNISLVSWK